MKISLAYFSFSALLYSTTSVVLNLRRNKICRPQMTAQTPISTKESYAFRVDKLSRNLLLTSLIAVSQSSRPVNAYSELDPSLQQNQRPDATDATVIQNGIPPDFEAVKRDIQSVIEDKPDKGPTLVRLAWHSSGTYDKITKNGGSSKGTIRFKEELAHGANKGLDIAVSWLDPIYKKYNKNADLSYADLYTLAGVVAIKTLGGPEIKWRAGRQDSFDPADVTPDGRLPEADKGSPEKTAAGLRTVFYRMGFGDREIVALSGAHALGRCHATASGYVGPWTFTPRIFNNQYFVLLKGLQWKPNPKSVNFQYQDPTGKLMMLPSDLVLIEDPEFKKYVDLYAQDQKLFFKDFADAFQRLEELGTSNLYEV